MIRHTAPTPADWRHLIHITAAAYVALVLLFAVGAALTRGL